MRYQIPVVNDLFDYTQEVELDGISYRFRFNYNLRMDSWVMDIGEELQGVRIVGGIDLIGQFHHLDVPPGEIRTLDLDGLDRDPNKTTFGDRVILVYDS
jgi:hypothetical protein